MRTRTAVLPKEAVENLIRLLRGQKVLLDADLAGVYGVTTTRLNQQVRRNKDRFPNDFAFRLTAQEFAALMMQNATSKKGRGGRRKLPLAFTEHGAIMAASVLNSPRAVQMSVFVVRAFVTMRNKFGQNRELAGELSNLERRLTERLDVHEKTLAYVLDEIRKLMEPTPVPEPHAPGEIGFHIREDSAPYHPTSRKTRR